MFILLFSVCLCNIVKYYGSVGYFRLFIFFFIYISIFLKLLVMVYLCFSVEERSNLKNG